MINSTFLEQEVILSNPGRFICEKLGNCNMKILDCVARQKEVKKLHRVAKSNIRAIPGRYLQTKKCLNCEQGKENKENLGMNICIKCGHKQKDHLKLGMCNACHSKDYRDRQKIEKEKLKRELNEMTEKLKEKEHEITLDFKKNPALLERIQCEAENEFREPWGQIMFILRERFEAGEKK